uniref:RING-type E3 ubiquitin transferase n=1 Tax=Tabanus bromius TaxID=304241 RepID=A0A0K8TS00_TABBR
MEYLNEGIVLGLDLLILGLCYKEYCSYKQTLKALKGAPQLPLDDSLKSYVQQQKDQKVPYAVIRGTVSPIGAPIKSVLSPTVTGVLQIMKLNEHRVARGFAGLWTEQKKLVHFSTNEVPFMITNGEHGVEVTEALSSAVLDLDVVYDNYEPSSLKLFDHLFGFFSGVRQKGFQTTEEILRDGSFITAVGEIELDAGNLRLQPSSIGPMFLTTATKGALIKKFEEAKSSMMVKMFISGAITALIIGIIGRRYFIRKKAERNERRLKETLEKARRERRAKTRPKANLMEEQLCVVCVTNPKEVICLPCGHVCLCEDCSEKIKIACPVCRTTIESKAAAFIS